MAAQRTHGEQLAVIAEVVERIELHQEASSKERAEISRVVAELAKTNEDIIRRLAAVEPVTEMVSSWRARMLGASMVLGFLGTVLMFFWVMLKDRASDVWKAVTGG